jgi:thiol-disulfide isomerase/thioredoxin
MNRFLACLLVSFLMFTIPIGDLFAQVSWCSPEEVRWGDTLTIFYNPNATKATLSVRDDVYAVFFMTMANGSYRDTCLQLTLRDNLFTCKYVPPDSVSHGRFSLETPEKRGNFGAEFTALRHDGIAAPGALLSKIWEKKLSAFTSELSLYPENYTAYTTKWEFQEYGEKLGESKLKEAVKADIAKLTKVSTPNSAQYAALAEGYQRVGMKVEQIAMLKRLAREYPFSPHTANALIRYSVKAEQSDTNAKAVRSIIRNIAKQYPSSPIAQQMLELSFADTTLTLAATKNIFDIWFAKEPNNPDPYLTYLNLSERGNVFSDSTVIIAQQLLELLMNRDILLRYRMNRPGPLCNAYRQVASTLKASGRVGQAFVALKAAQAFVSEADTKAGLFVMEGSLLLLKGQPTLAQDAFVNAYALGSKSAKDSVLRVYKSIRGTDSGFATFIKRQSDSILALNAKPAITFTAKGMDGKTYDIAALRGKVVVLNFWFIGCAPCRMEIPGLNTLVKEFANKDVVFLALALDEEKDLKEFLKKTPFAYTIIPKTSEIADLHSVEGFPTHIIIDRKGMNIGQLVGGSEKRHEDIRPLIERALE